MIQTVLFRQQPLAATPLEALLACFPGRPDLSAAALVVDAEPYGQLAGRMVCWAWREVGDQGLLTEELLGEGDPDDQSVPTRRGLVVRIRDAAWLVVLADALATDQQLGAELRAIIERCLAI
jgi:hypothetical protein